MKCLLSYASHPSNKNSVHVFLLEIFKAVSHTKTNIFFILKSGLF